MNCSFSDFQGANWSVQSEGERGSRRVRGGGGWRACGLAAEAGGDSLGKSARQGRPESDGGLKTKILVVFGMTV